MNKIPRTTPMMQNHEINVITYALQLLQKHNDISALEWGSGNSTLYYSSLLNTAATWNSIEHNREWYDEVRRQLAQGSTPANVNLTFVGMNAPLRFAEDDGTPEAFHDYIKYPTSLGKTFNFILVDGRARVACLNEGWQLLANNGLMVLHDAERREYDKGIPTNAHTLRIADLESQELKSILLLSNDLDTLQEIDKYCTVNFPLLYKKLTTVQSNRRNDKDKPRALFINTYYPPFLSEHYTKHPPTGLSYKQLLQSLLESKFGDSDFYSKHLGENGWEVENIIANDTILQTQWQKENSTPDSLIATMAGQIMDFRPDVIYFQDLSVAPPQLVDALKQLSRLVVGQIASPIPPGSAPERYDIIFSSFPHFVSRFRSHGITSFYQPLAFEPALLDSQAPERNIPVSFVGGLSRAHGKGLDFLQRLADLLPSMDFWGYGADSLPEHSPIRQRHHGEVWGQGMFDTLRRSIITVNRHIDVAEQYANNMRLFEATGCGALLITDYKDNLGDLFEIGKEIVAYRSAEECAELIRYYLANPDEAKAIAQAGQARTLRDYTYAINMAETSEILKRHLRYKEDWTGVVPPSQVSTGYQPIADSLLDNKLTQGWLAEELPGQQRQLVQHELSQLFHGNFPTPFRVLAQALIPLLGHQSQVLEIGCSSGYYYEVLQYLTAKRFNYTGVDYSSAFIKMARDYYPTARFEVADGASLPFDDNQFDVVISGCILLHVANWQRHLNETNRVAKRYIVLHRTPICRNSPTQYFKKEAYGVPTIELRFNENELLLPLMGSSRLIGAYEYAADERSDCYEITYVLEKKSQ